MINDVMQNGSQLTNTQIGANNTSLSAMGNAGLTGGSLQTANVTAGGVNPISGVQAQQPGNFFKNADGSVNTNNIGLVVGGIQTLGSLWNSYQQQKIAKEQLALQRQAFQTNLTNNTKTYNTALADRIRSRYVTEGKTSAQANQYLSANKL